MASVPLQSALPHVPWDSDKVEWDYEQYESSITRTREFTFPRRFERERDDHYRERVEKARAEHFDIPTRMTSKGEGHGES